MLDRKDALVTHIVQSIGSSSKEKADTFAKKHAGSATPTLCASYQEVYNDPYVDIVYIGTPHSLNLKNSLDAIAAGKNVLCEKPLTINAKETEQVIAAAKAKGVFYMEASGRGSSPFALRCRNSCTRTKSSALSRACL